MRLAHLLPAALAAAAIAGCSSDLKSSPCGDGSGVADVETLTADRITVEVRRDPYALVVRDASGKAVLESVGDGSKGNGALGWTAGRLDWSIIAAPGWYGEVEIVNGWHEDYRVVAVTRTGTDTLTLALAPKVDGDSCLHVTLTVRAGALRFESTVDGVTPRLMAASFKSPSAEGFLGFGERFNRTEQRGRTLYSWPEEGGLAKGEKFKADAGNPFPNGEGMTYYPVPWFLSTTGYGFWLDSDWRNQFELADPLAGGVDRWRVWDSGPRLAFEVFVPAVMTDPRPWPQQLVDAFTARVGRPMVAPPWSFGPRRRIDSGSMADGKLEIQAMRDRDLAITAADDAMHFLPNASETGNEAQIAAWTQSARALGYRTVAYFNALFSDGAGPLSAEVASAIGNNYFLRDANGKAETVFLSSGGFTNVYQVDFTSAAATSWYTAHFQKALDLGYSGWMYDFGEYVQPAMVASDGRTGEELHNRYPVLYDKAGHDALEATTAKGDWMFFARSGYTGSSQYTPIVWSGDPTASFEDALGLPAMVRAGVNIGLSGVPHWGSDIGGYKCIPDGSKFADGELLARWIEVGSVSGDMHDENACALGDGPKATIWSSPDAMAAWLKYARLHTRLFPYLYTLANQAHVTGAPLMRHMFFEHPEVPALASVDDAFYLGPALLAAPVVKRGATTKMVTLPDEPYLDWDAQQVIGPGGAHVIDAPLGKLPLLLRAGQIVPLLDATIDTLAEENNPDVIGPSDVADVYDALAFLAPTAPQATFTLYDGGTLDVKQSGAYADPALALAKDEAEFATCKSCYLPAVTSGGATRIRIATADGTVTAGGIVFTSKTGRRTRWDLYVVTP